MAAPVYATDMTAILLEFPNTTGWSAIGGGASGLNAPETDYFAQNANCITKNAWASALKGMIYDNGSGITVPTDGAVIMWLAHATMNSVAAQSSGGLRAIIGSGSGAYKHWYVGGSDTEVFGLWNPYPVDPTVTADATTGSPSATLQFFGALANLPSGGPTKGSPWAIDAMRYGRCTMQVTDGDAGNGYATLAGLEATANSLANRWGLLELIKGTYYMQGFLSLGLSATAVDWRDSNRVIAIRDTLRVSANFNRIEVINASSNVELTNYTVTSLGTTSKGVLIVTAGTLTMTSCRFVDFGATTLLSSSAATGCVWLRCDSVTAAGANLSGSTFTESTAAADGSAVVWNVATDPDTKTDGCTWSKGAAAHHAIELGTSSPLTMTFRNCVFTGFNASNAQNDSTFHVLRSTSTVTINLIGCSGVFSYKTAGATVNVVISPVTTKITVKDHSDALYQGARVLVEAGDGSGDLPFEDSVSITRSGSTASVTHTAHGMADGAKVAIRGAAEQEYNGVFAITNVTANAYDYTVSGSPATPATGAPTATGVVVSGLTDASGQISASQSFSVDQNVRGKIRKATASPLYKSIDFTDTIDKDAGLTRSSKFVLDE